MKELLRGRYTLMRGPVTSDRLSETWIARDARYDFCLLRIWPFVGDDISSYQRALWDGELRTLYRLSSSPAAEDSLLLMKDAGVDKEEKVFVMALQGTTLQDYLSLEMALSGRRSHPWLGTRDVEVRKEIWRAFGTLADGVALLHGQRVIHRNLNASAVFLDPHLGPASMRLGGFEWSIRLGVPARIAPPDLWSLSRECFGPEGPRFGPENDWFGFGMLLSRALLNLEPLVQVPPAKRQELALARVQKATRRDLSELEQAVLLELLAIDPVERLSIDELVLAGVEGVEKSFDEIGALGRTEELVLVIDPKLNALQASVSEADFQPNPDDKLESFDVTNSKHVSRLLEFVREDLALGRIYSVPNATYFVLDGEVLTFVIAPFVHGDTGKASWDYAFATNLGFVNSQGDDDSVVRLPERIISVWSVGEVYRFGGQKAVRSWDSVLPRRTKGAVKKRDFEKFLDFIRCGNQLELLKLSEEIFRCRVVSREDIDAATEAIWIREDEDRGDWKGVFGRSANLYEYLKREKESYRPKCDWVDLMSGETTALFRRSVPDEEWWRIEKFDPREERVLLYRQRARKNPDVAVSGFLRTFGFYGQLELIRRRKEAIERLEEHAYLLESLTSPGNVKIDTGDLDRLPALVSEGEVDLWKQAVIEDVLRTRPIYAVQGPPGTGKTTLVANLVLQILTEDPVAQILITAQANAALDVLRGRVADGLEADAPDEKPIAVRLGGKALGAAKTEGSVEEVAARILSTTIEELEQLSERSAFQNDWLAAVRNLVGSLEQKGKRSPGDFLELVKRSANITYCTTSARDLEILASGAQSFDWSIIEEAGKVHGFDLALPLQAGHRWLLIGDQKQLEPFAYEEYFEVLGRLDAAVEALDSLPGTGGLLDIDWIRRWQALDSTGQHEMVEYCKYWLKSFEIIYNKCSSVGGETRLTEDKKAVGASAGWLRRQYRMHPSIATIVSKAYYGGRLESMTSNDDGSPISKVCHSVAEPEEIGSRAVVWLDIPWARYEARCREMGPRDGLLKYGNRAECVAIRRFLKSIRIDDSFDDSLEIAVLSPYNQQVSALRKALEHLDLPRQFVLKEALGKSRLEGFRKTEIAHTVDSFQGNEADIVLVSLVRNNPLPPAQGFGFMKSPSRINVLFSRAQRLLILVGSWDFFQYQISTVDLQDPSKALWHWGMTLDTLRGMFKSGEAVRLQGSWKW